MSERDTFGPRLRRERERRGISLETLALVTKVGVELWDGLERNDFSRWPSGIFARAFIRDYARAVGLDADELVDEFCRLFPHGDRRATRIMKAQARLIGHQPSSDDPSLLPAGGDRRTSGHEAQAAARERWARRAPRLIAAGVDLACNLSLAMVAARLTGAAFWSSAGVLSLFYFAASTIALGRSPGALAAEQLRQRVPALFTRRAHA